MQPGPRDLAACSARVPRRGSSPLRPAARIAWAVLAGTALLLASAACSTGAAPDSFDAARAWRDLEHLVALGPRPAGSEALEKTRAYIESELTHAGLHPQREPFRVSLPPGFEGTRPTGDAFELANVFADLETQAPDGEIVILCTHFDTKLSSERFVGANDGGSGTAVLLELARVLAASGPHSVTYRFLFLDGEEALRRDWKDPDNTYGSRQHAASLKRSGVSERVRACVLLDMVGDSDLGLVRESYSDRRLVELFFGAARRCGFGAHVDVEHEEIRDDHLSFMSVGIPSIDLIDFDYGPHNSYWHTPQDTLEHCSMESLSIVGRIVLAGLPELERSFRRR
jgi:glutaminyl-peptide cyclotransferase